MTTDIQTNWERHLIASELAFWEQWMETRGLDWPQDYEFRMCPETQVQHYLRPFIDPSRKGFHILDVGSGPLTMLGKMYNHWTLKITRCDALGEAYNDLLIKYDLFYGHDNYVQPARMESLANVFSYNNFDLVHAQNCVDHSINPLKAINQMILVCRKGGTVFLRHQPNEAIVENYQGLHQWNFALNRDSHLVIYSRQESIAAQKILQMIWGEEIQMECSLTDNYVQVVIRKK